MVENYIPERLAQLRIKKGVSEKEMSLALGFQEDTIRNIEAQRTLPTLDTFLSICTYLNVKPNEFFDEENKNPVLLNQLMEKMEDLKESDFDTLYQLLLKGQKLVKKES